jgi:hypothetical protein
VALVAIRGRHWRVMVTRSTGALAATTAPIPGSSLALYSLFLPLMDPESLRISTLRQAWPCWMRCLTLAATLLMTQRGTVVRERPNGFRFCHKMLPRPPLLSLTNTCITRLTHTRAHAHTRFVPQQLYSPIASHAAAICMDPAAISELQQDFNISVNITGGAFPESTGPTGEFFHDILTLFQALAVVSNSGPNDVGGPGLRVAPTALPLCASAS